MFCSNEHIKNWLAGADPFQRLGRPADLGGEVFRQKEGRVTFRCMLGGRAYFVKFHTGIGWKEIFKNLLQLRLPVVSAANEWRAIKRLHAIGIGTMQLAAYGGHGLNPARRKSFVVTEELKTTISLEDYCRGWAAQPPAFPLKQDLLRRVATISAAMHGNGMCHRDYYLCHFLLYEDAEDNEHPKKSEYHGQNRRVGQARPAEHDTPTPRLWLIDLHRALCRRHLRRRWVVKDLGGLYYSAMSIGLSRRDILRFIRYYEGAGLRYCLSHRAGFWRRVQRRAHSLRLRLQK